MNPTLLKFSCSMPVIATCLETVRERKIMFYISVLCLQGDTNNCCSLVFLNSVFFFVLNIYLATANTFSTILLNFSLSYK